MKILVTGARAPIAADIAKALALSGHQVWVADSCASPVAASSPFVQRLVRLPPPRTDFRGFVSALAAACTSEEIDAVIPTSEEVFWLAGAAPFLPDTVNVRISPLPVLAQLHHKGAFARLAASLGYGVPESREITSPSELDGLTDLSRLVLKPAYSRFATQTLISPTFRQLRGLQPSAASPWLVQARVTGRELSAYNVAHDGRLLLHVAYEPMFRIGVGASAYFSPVIHPRLRAMSEQFIAATNFTGQISFDAMETTQGLVALECNPRGTSGAHLAVQQPAAFASSLLGQDTDTTVGANPSPRMLLLPLLLKHPVGWLRAADRQRLRIARDALSVSGICLAAQIRSIAEMAGRAAREGMSIPAVSTADFEWNGEPMGG